MENEDVKLDNMFIASLVGDIIRVSIGWKVCACMCICMHVLFVHNNNIYNAMQYASQFYYVLCILYFQSALGSILSVFIELGSFSPFVITFFIGFSESSLHANNLFKVHFDSRPISPPGSFKRSFKQVFETNICVHILSCHESSLVAPYQHS